MTVSLILVNGVKSIAFHDDDVAKVLRALNVARHKLESVAGPDGRELHDWCASVTSRTAIHRGNQASKTFDTMSGSIGETIT